VVDNWQGTHTLDEICLIQHDWVDSFNAARRGYYGISAMPTIAGNGLQDVWPDSWLEADYQAHAALPSPMRISLTENGEGDFTAHLVAEEDITAAKFCMVATLDEFVPSATGMSHLPHHAKVFMTAVTGDPFELAAGESLDINKTFIVEPGWDYNKMGVGAWVQKPGGFNPSPCPYADLSITNGVLQSRWIAAGGTSVAENGGIAKLVLSPPSPNPFLDETKISFALPNEGSVSVELYDVVGRRVTSVFDGNLEGGGHEVFWNGRDASGEHCAAGIYFVRVTYAGRETADQKVVKLK
jgi:hypothetical protein